jgi:glutathione S-transferase
VTVTLYDYAASGNCYKVRLLLAQLGRDYERVPVDIFDGDTLTDEFAALNPHRSTPVLVLPDGRTLIESNAILWYLAHGTAFLPDDPFGRAEVCRWLIYEQTDVMPMIGGLRFRLLTGRFAPDSERAQRRLAGAHEVLEILDGHLGERPFLAAGRYTIADIAVFAYSHVARRPGSRPPRTADSGTGSAGSLPSPGSSTTSSPTRRTPRSSPAGRSTADSSRASLTRPTRSG